MRVRDKASGALGFSNRFNMHGLGEIILVFEEGGGDSDYITNYDIWLEQTQSWKNMHQAFQDEDLITDNYQTIFFEPKTKEDRVRGYTF